MAHALKVMLLYAVAKLYDFFETKNGTPAGEDVRLLATLTARGFASDITNHTC